MVPSARSSGVATVAAIVSGLAPGRLAVTVMTGNSTCGNGATGISRNDSAPAIATPSVSKVVATGRSMKGVTNSLSCYLVRGGSHRFLATEAARVRRSKAR